MFVKMTIGYGRVLLACFLLLFPVAMWADPDDCMTQSEAEQLAAKIKTQGYIMDFCDCCDEVAQEYGGDRYVGQLVLVASVSVEACSYDETRFSVRVEGTSLGGFILQDNALASFQNEQMFYSEVVARDYHFYLDKSGPKRLGFLTDANYDRGCGGLLAFPARNIVRDSKYTSWLNKNGAKWRCKKAIFLAVQLS
ncbi:MAG: hypothetical protein HC912_05205 [Saprospiraceae bacterium]|nr:hypothetical protein [Saprospiraceae bacterium]